MTYGQVKRAALRLLNASTIAGSEIPLSYNDQADLVLAMPSLVDDAVMQIATTVKKIPAAVCLDKLEQLSRGQEEGPGMDTVGGMPENGPGDANLFEQAVEFAIADGQISTSTLQRRLKVGYARAGRLTDEMEERGIVSAKDGSKPRKCLITREQWEAMRETGRGPAAEG